MSAMLGATVETVMSAVRSKLIVLGRWDALVASHGIDRLEDAMYLTGEQHQGCTEIGSSDVNHMVNGTLCLLGEPGLW